MDEQLEVKVARTHPDAKLPTRGSEYAAGWDLYALEEVEVPFRQSVKLRTGLHVAIPVGYEGQVRARSSLGSKGLILPHSIGTIDADYRGELFVLMTWLGEGDSYTVKAGERIAQILISPIWARPSVERAGSAAPAASSGPKVAFSPIPPPVDS